MLKLTDDTSNKKHSKKVDKKNSDTQLTKYLALTKKLLDFWCLAKIFLDKNVSNHFVLCLIALTSAWGIR